MGSPFEVEIEPDWRGLVSCIRRQGTPQRVHFFEISLDLEVQQAVARRFGLREDGPDDPYYECKLHLAVQRLLGYDYVCCRLDDAQVSFERQRTTDTAALARAGGRAFAHEHQGPVSSWRDFETYPWPDPEKASLPSLDWFTENLPPDMCIVGVAPCVHLPEIMGFETLCYALYDDRDLVKAISRRIERLYAAAMPRMLQYERVQLVLGMDDMGFRSGTLISPEDLREFVLPGHRIIAQHAHAAGRPYILHCCGKIDAIMEDVIEDVGIDAKHSFEDTIESVMDAKAAYGGRIAVLGGVDVDFLCRAQPAQVRQRVRETLNTCMAGGGYCLGTGNSVTNYVPLENYFAMLDEGRRFGADCTARQACRQR